mmetsp:Transcript_42323/g.104154  ORF Transcript_42323/g.104154 Transcript_42323/m.104154 type:complete len:150 (+) Transcript_42323:218-667(+)
MEDFKKEVFRAAGEKLMVSIEDPSNGAALMLVPSNVLDPFHVVCLKLAPSAVAPLSNMTSSKVDPANLANLTSILLKSVPLNCVFSQLALAFSFDPLAQSMAEAELAMRKAPKMIAKVTLFALAMIPILVILQATALASPFIRGEMHHR